MSKDTKLPITIERLEDFADAWNRHDVDELMTFMADDCSYRASTGADKCGKLYSGRAAVKEGFARIFTVYPDAHWSEARHFICGNRAVSEWVFSGTSSDGSMVRSDGCDLFTIDHDGKILIKDSYRKIPVP
jgi:ketosteroid isomerase-like protein